MASYQARGEGVGCAAKACGRLGVELLLAWLAVGLFSCLVTFGGRAGLAWRALDSMGIH